MSKIDYVGVQTQNKLLDIAAAAHAVGISGINAVHNSITTGAACAPPAPHAGGPLLWPAADAPSHAIAQPCCVHVALPLTQDVSDSSIGSPVPAQCAKAGAVGPRTWQ